MTETTTTPPRSRLLPDPDARRTASALSKLTAIIRRVEHEGLGRNFAATKRAVEAHYRNAISGVLAVEDRHGVTAPASYYLADRTRQLLNRAEAVGLLSRGTAYVIEADLVDRTPPPT